MKILIYGLNFAPELTGVGKYTGELAAWLAARGHEVFVIAAPPYYPSWQVQEGYSAHCYRTKRWRRVTVTRVPLWVPARPGGVKRLLHMASFALTSLPVLIRRAAQRPDIILAVAPPLMCAPAAWLAARLCGARAWLHIQDYEVDAAFGLGLLKGEWLQRLLLRLERRLLRRFDRVSTISGRMLELAHLKGVDRDKLVALPNWIDVDSVANPQQHGNYREELNLPANAIVALYSGNMGAKQGLDTLAAAARQLAEHPTLWFVFCGEGPGREPLQTQCIGLQHVRFIRLQPTHRLGELLAMADIHLLPQRADAADLVMPSKLAGMLASGRPVVCGASPGTELAAVVQGKGLVVPPDDGPAMALALDALASAPAWRAALGAAAQAHAREHLHMDIILSQAERDLEACLQARPAD